MLMVDFSALGLTAAAKRVLMLTKDMLNVPGSHLLLVSQFMSQESLVQCL